MSIALAVRRCTRFYAPSLRRWTARNVNPFMFWFIGLFTGLGSGPVDPARRASYFVAGLLLLWLLRQWAAGASDAPSDPSAHGLPLGDQAANR